MNRRHSPTLMLLVCLILAGPTSAENKNYGGTREETKVDQLRVLRERVRDLQYSRFRSLSTTQPTVDLHALVKRLENARISTRLGADPELIGKVDVPEELPPEVASRRSMQSTTAPAEDESPDSERIIPYAVFTGQAHGATTRPTHETIALKQLKALPAEGVLDPIALADALFLAGSYEVASTFYEQALDQADFEETRAWLLYQLGNCYRDREPEAAMGYFRRLLNEHPKCPWAKCADSQLRLIRWRLSNKPRELLKEIAAEVEES